MAIYILNEWFWADCSGETNESRQREAFKFVVTFVESKDAIVVVRDSPFQKKLWKLCSNCRTVTEREVARLFNMRVLYDSSKCIYLAKDDLEEIPTELAGEVKDDDHYLIRAQLKVSGSIIVTMDGPLIDVLRKHGMAHEHRDRFLSCYSC